MTLGRQLPPVFNDEERCLEWLWRRRFSDDGVWADCPECKKCRRFKRYVTAEPTRAWFCPTCTHRLNVLTGTLLARTQLPVATWFRAIRLVAEGAGGKDLERALGTSVPASHRMKHAILDWLADGASWPDERKGYPKAIVSLRAPVRVRSVRPERTHCQRGHALTGTNVYVTPKGVSQCRACDRIRKQKTRAPCPECGKLMSVFSKTRGYRMCGDCLVASHRRQREATLTHRGDVRKQVMEIDPGAARRAKALYRKSPAPAGKWCSEKQKAILRMLQVASRPLSARKLSDFFARLPRRWVGYERDGIRKSLVNLERRGFVYRVPNENRRMHGPRCVWLIAEAGSLVRGKALTLDDAIRERELAHLIAEQEKDQRWGHREIDFKSAFSLDSAATEDGGSWHEAFEDLAA